MRNPSMMFRALLVTLLLFAQHGAVAHALKHTTETEKSIAHAELCMQCLDFAQMDAGPLSLDLPELPVAVCAGLFHPLPALRSVISSSVAFDFHSRAPPVSIA